MSASAPKTGTERVFATVRSNGRATVVVTGVVGDYGRSFPANSKGKADPQDNFEEVVLQRGTLLLDERGLSKNRPAVHYNKATCSLSLSVTAKVPVSLGTGAYTGLHGSLVATANVADDDPRVTSGPAAGQCEEGEIPPAASYFADVIGTGTFTL